MTFEIARRAQNAIEKIIDYYSENEPTGRAIKVLDSFYLAFQSAARNPLIHPIDFHYKGKHEIRRGVIHETYVFKYKVLKSKIVILVIYHGKRNIS